MPVLQIDSVLHAYGDQKVLRDVFLKCHTGEVIGILGRNGSGKTTLLEVIFGKLKADSSAIHIDGRYIKNCLKETGIVYLPQFSFLPRQLTTRQCILMYIDKKADREDLLSIRRIRDKIACPVGNLAGGERRFLEIMLILTLESDFVLLDEPFTELESFDKKMIKTYIRKQLKSKGFILTDSNYLDAVTICSRLFLLAEGNLKELENSAHLVECGYLPSYNIFSKKLYR